MKTLAAVDLLEGWERGRAACGLTGSALALLCVANPEMPWRTLAELSIGRRDSLLFQLRQQMFGDDLRGLVSCPQCKETLEVDFGVADIYIPRELDDGEEEALTRFSMQSGEYEIEFRLPNSFDLMALHRATDVAEGQQILFDRVLVNASRGGQTIAVEDLPQDILSLAEDHMEKIDPQADVTLNLQCKACDSRCETLFDIASFLWREVDAWAIARLREVHVLASAYGWREADILAMSLWRRQCYMEMVG
jgi:hypothetical protein